MFTVLTDDIEVFRILEIAGRATFDMRKNRVDDFILDDLYFLLIFHPVGIQKGVHLFSVRMAEIGRVPGLQLLDALLAFPENDGLGPVKSEALALIAKRISERNLGREFFDAH
ncbi:MAG TPA: hypothetical protein VFU15_02010 [Bacteroidia bacterium]|nr:hypothetical protein [Bacteroidia bacterium]